jgi:hypothetical protein
LENVDWVKLDEMSLDKAFKEAFDEFLSKGVEPTADKILARQKYWYDYIWLMGPLPMKEGYEPPKVDFKLFEL